MLKHIRLRLVTLLTILLVAPLLSQQEVAHWKQDIPLPRNQRITLWLDRGWLKAARLNENNELLWAVVLRRWSTNEKLRIDEQGAGVNVYGPNDELILRNSKYDSYPPMVLRCNHSLVVPDTEALIDPSTFKLGGFYKRGFTDDGLTIRTSESRSSETHGWIYCGAGPTTSSRFQYIVRLQPRQLYKDNVAVRVGTDGLQAWTGEYQMYDEGGFLFVQQMSDVLASRQTTSIEPLIDKKAPPLNVLYWLNATKPIVIDSLRGSVVLLYFWGVWCQPCVKHLSDLESLSQRFVREPFRVVSIHTLTSSDQLAGFLESRRITFPIGVDSGKTVITYAQNTVPRYVLIDKHGVVCSISSDPPSDILLRQVMAR